MSAKPVITGGTSRAPYNGPTYKVAPPEYVCNVCGHRELVGRTNNVGQTEGAPPMLRHLRDKHGYQPQHVIRDWREHIERAEGR